MATPYKGWVDHLKDMVSTLYLQPIYNAIVHSQIRDSRVVTHISPGDHLAKNFPNLIMLCSAYLQIFVPREKRLIYKSSFPREKGFHWEHSHYAIKIKLKLPCGHLDLPEQMKQWVKIWLLYIRVIYPIYSLTKIN